MNQERQIRPREPIDTRFRHHTERRGDSLLVFVPFGETHRMRLISSDPRAWFLVHEIKLESLKPGQNQSQKLPAG